MKTLLLGVYQKYKLIFVVSFLVLIFVMGIGVYLYIKNLNNTIDTQNDTIKGLEKELIQNKLVYDINTKTLKSAMDDQNKKIQKMQMDNQKYLDNFFVINNKIEEAYENKLKEASKYNDKNCSEKLNMLERMINEEVGE